MLHKHSIIIKTKIIILVWYYLLNNRVCVDFTSFSTNVLFGFKYPFQVPTLYIAINISIVLFSLWKFLSLFLYFMTLTLWKNTGQIFCRMSLNLVLFWCVFMISLRLYVIGKNTLRAMIYLLKVMTMFVCELMIMWIKAGVSGEV